LDESHKLDSWPLDEGPRPKSGILLRLNLHGIIKERKSIGSNTEKKKAVLERAHGLKNQYASKASR